MSNDSKYTAQCFCGDVVIVTLVENGRQVP